MSLRSFDGNDPGCVVHGSNASMARPDYQGIVLWVGTVEPTNRATNDIWFNPNAPGGDSLGLYESNDATIHGVVAAKLISGQGPDVNGFVYHGNTSPETGYGKGQAFMVLEPGAGDATDSTGSGSVLFRIDRRGNLGMLGGLHIATGMRDTDTPLSQAVWIDPSDNIPALVISNPLVAESATWDQDFIKVLDARNGNARLWGIDQTGAMTGTMGITAGLGTANQVTLGDVFGVGPGFTFSNLTDTLFYRSGVGIMTLHNALTMPERAEPAAPAADNGTLFLRDNGAGKTQLCIKFNTGVPIVIATQA